MITRIASNGEALRYSSPNKLDSMIFIKKIWEASNRGFCYFLSKSNVFVVLTTLRFIKTTNALPRAMGCTPFLTLTVQKIHCFFGPQKWPRKNRRELRTEKIASRNFCLPIARINVRFVREQRRQKREIL